MPETMSTPEVQSPPIEASQSFLKKILPQYTIPQDFEAVRKWQTKLSALSKEVQLGASSFSREMVQSAAAELFWHKGELEVALPYFENIKDRIQQIKVDFRKEGRAGVKGRRYEIDGKRVSEEQANTEAAVRALEERRAKIRKVIRENEDKLKKEDVLSPLDQGRDHAARVIDNNVNNLVATLTTGSAKAIGQVIGSLEKRADKLSSLDREPTEAVLEAKKEWLPMPGQMKALSEAPEVRAGFEGKETTFLGKRITGALKECTEAIVGKSATIQELGNRSGLDLETAAREKTEQVLAAKARRIVNIFVRQAEGEFNQDYISDTLKREDFEQNFKGRLAKEEELRQEIENREIQVRGAEKIDGEKWQNRFYWRRWAREALPEVTGGFQNTTWSDKALGDRILQITPDASLHGVILDDPKVRKAIVRHYGQVKRGDIAWGGGNVFYGRENPTSFNLNRKDESAPVLGDLVSFGDLSVEARAALGITGTVEDRIALEVLQTWLVHPEPPPNTPTFFEAKHQMKESWESTRFEKIAIKIFRRLERSDPTRFKEAFGKKSWQEYKEGKEGIEKVFRMKKGDPWPPHLYYKVWLKELERLFKEGDNLVDEKNLAVNDREFLVSLIKRKQAFEKCFGPFDAVRRWYLSHKWSDHPEDVYMVAKILGTDRLFGEDMNDLWFLLSGGKPIEDFEDKWEEIKRDKTTKIHLLDIAPTFLDKGKKTTDTADALMTLITKGLTPENVFEFLREKEHFKYLNGEDRRMMLRRFYNYAFERLIFNFRERAQLEAGGGFLPGTKERLRENLANPQLIDLGILTKEEYRKRLKEIKKIPERGHFWVDVKNPNWRYHHRVWWNPLTFLIGSIPGTIIGKIGNEELGRRWSSFVKRWIGWNPYGVAVIAPASFLYNFWQVMDKIPLGPAAFNALEKTFVSGATFGFKQGIVGLAGSSGFLMILVTQLFNLFDKIAERTTKSYADQQEEENTINQIKSKRR